MVKFELVSLSNERHGTWILICANVLYNKFSKLGNDCLCIGHCKCLVSVVCVPQDPVVANLNLTVLVKLSHEHWHFVIACSSIVVATYDQII